MRPASGAAYRSPFGCSRGSVGQDMAAAGTPGCTSMGTTIREQTHVHVRRLTLCRPDQYNTITPELRDELGAAIDGAELDPRDSGDPARRRGSRVLRRLRARLVHARPGRRRAAHGSSVGFGGRPAHDRVVRRHVGEVARLLQTHLGGGIKAGASPAAPTSSSTPTSSSRRSPPGSGTRRHVCGACPKRPGTGWHGWVSRTHAGTC